MPGTEAKRVLQSKVYAETGGHCFYCQRKLPAFRESENRVTTLDHVVPRVYGGTTGLTNLVLSCRKCNGTKSDWIIPGYIWKDREALKWLLLTGSCRYGTISECCGNDVQFRPRTKNEVLQIWKTTCQDSKISLLNSMKIVLPRTTS